jgi:hypothetical protein
MVEGQHLSAIGISPSGMAQSELCVLAPPRLCDFAAGGSPLNRGKTPVN